MANIEQISRRLRWRNELLPLLAVGAALGLSACGQFGDAPPRAKSAMGSGPGCLNELGDTVSKYTTGEATEEKTAETWDCVIDAMDMFQRFVKGSDDDGASYSQRDITALISNFMVTDRPIPEGLVDAGFSLKASIFGGSPARITPKEFGRVLAMVRVMKKESVGMLPYIRHYNRSKDYLGLLSFADALVNASSQFQNALEVQGNQAFSKAHARVLIGDLGTLFKWDFAPELVDFLFAAKTLMLGGTTEEIEHQAWPRMFRLGGTFGGVILGLTSTEIYPKKDTAAAIRYFLELGRRVQGAMHETLDYHGGALHLRHFDAVVDNLPSSWIDLPKPAIKAALRPAINKLFKSRLRDRIEHRSIDFLFGLLLELGRTQAHVESLYVRSKAAPEGLTRQEFAAAAEDYAYDLDAQGKADVARLKGLVQNYMPLYYGDEISAYFGNLDTYSLRYLSMLSLIDRLMAHLIEAYSGSIQASQIQFESVVSDYSEILAAYGVVKKGDTAFAGKRFMEANIFLPSSNGDSYLNQSEGVYYGLYILSFTLNIPTVEADIGPLCRLDETPEGARPWMDADCFKREYAARAEKYLAGFPFILDTFRALTPEQKLQFVGFFMDAGEQCRPSAPGQPLKPCEVEAPSEYWMPADLDAFVGFVHFAEGIFQRVDINRDDIIDLAELRIMFPIYKNLILEMVNKNIKLPSFLTGDGILFGAFAYIFKFAKFPAGIFDIPQLVAWLLAPYNWQVHSDRFLVVKALAGMAKMM